MGSIGNSFGLTSLQILLQPDNLILIKPALNLPENYNLDVIVDGFNADITANDGSVLAGIFLHLFL